MRLSQKFLSKYRYKETTPMTPLGEFVYYRTYSRFLPEKGRREYWWETCRRAVEYNCSIVDTSEEEAEKLFDNMYNLKQFLAGRTLWVGDTESAKKFPMSNFNCSFLKIDSIKSYCDMFYLLMLGSGVGFRTFKEDVDKLPKFRKNITLTHKPYTPIKKEDRQEDTTYSENRYFAELVVGDSKEGWVDALRIFLEIFSLDAKKRYKQLIINYNNVRPRGERLKTFGGTASGHESLMLMLNKIYQLFRSKKTDDFKLTTLDCLDIANMLAENVVSGGVRRCLPEDTLVHTKNGLVKIKDINIGDLVSTSKGYHPVTAKTYQGFQDTIKIKTQLGTLECTENHKIAVIDDVYNNYIWKKASELKYGDRVIFVKNYLEGIDTELPEFKYENPPHSTTCKDIKIPKLDEDTAYLLGYFHGDGYVRLTNNSGEISLAVDSRHISIKNKLCDILTRFNVNVGIQEPKEEDKCFKIRVKSKQLAEYFSKFKTPNSEIEIPDFILRGNSSVRVSYVSGLIDADGSFRNSTYTIVSSVYPKFIKQVQVLMSSFGVASYIVSRKRNNLNWKDIHTLKVKGRDFTDCYIKLFKDKCLKFEKPHNNSISYYSYGYPKEMVMKENFKGLCKYWDKKCNQITVETLNRFMNRDSSIVPIEVISVGEGNRDVDTYDISVDSVEEFVCDSGYLVHNSSQINLSEIEDKSIRDAKTNLFTQDENGNWILDEKLSHRMKSNNSIGFRKKPTREELEEIFKSIRYSGEPGFINMEEAKRRFTSFTGTNPCGEILLPNNGLCNLVTVNVYGFVEDGKLNKKELLEAFELNARAAYRMTCLTLELEHWDRVQKEHRLIGCSMTGWQDAMSVLNYDMRQQSDLLKEIKDTVKHAVREYATMLGTKECKLATTIKPEGTLSLLPTVSPGVHHSYSPYYIRRIRISSDDPLLKVCEDLGLTVLNEVGQDDKTCNTKVVEFYVKSPTDKTRNDVSAIEQLETYKMFMENYVEHNASNTITVKKNEWGEVIDWVYDNWDCIVGVTFLSIDDNYYPLMPYESITEDEYKAGYKNITITPELISKYENVQVEELEIGSDDECSSGGSCPIR